MKPHGLVVRDGEGCRSPGIDRIPALLTDSSSSGDLAFSGSGFCNKCNILAGCGLDCSEIRSFSCLLGKIYRLRDSIYLSLQLLEVFTAHLSPTIMRNTSALACGV